MKTKTPEFTAADLAALLQHPDARLAAIQAGWAPGVEVDVTALAEAMAEHGYYVTDDIAWRVGRRQGHNLRCNRCGTYGATWYQRSHTVAERPGWGHMALCPPHKQELIDEHDRHEAALAWLRTVNFENR